MTVSFVKHFSLAAKSVSIKCLTVATTQSIFVIFFKKKIVSKNVTYNHLD